MKGQALYTKNCLVFYSMRKPTIPERIDIIKNAVGVTEDTEFGKLAGMSKSVVNQLRTEKMKSIAARYAYKLEENTGFCAKWIQLGEGIERTDQRKKLLDKSYSDLNDLQKNQLLQICNTLAQPAEGTNGKQ